MKSIGIDFGGTSIKFGVVEGCEIIDRAEALTPADFLDPEGLIDAIAATVLQLSDVHSDIMAVGCGVPGFVDYRNGTIHNLTNVPGWVNIGLKAELERRTALPTVVENDANAMAIAEWKLGAAKGCDHAVCLTLGTGVGGGIIVNGEMVRGSQYAAGELGQTSIDYRGRRGNYNNLGALEGYLGNKEFSKDTQLVYREAGMEKSLCACSPEALSVAASEGCEVAIRSWDSYAVKLAASLASVCWLLNPEVLVIGGGIANAGEHLFTPLRKHVNDQLSGPFREHLSIRKAHFANDSGILGCATLALLNLEDPGQLRFPEPLAT